MYAGPDVGVPLRDVPGHASVDRGFIVRLQHSRHNELSAAKHNMEAYSARIWHSVTKWRETLNYSSVRNNVPTTMPGSKKAEARSQTNSPANFVRIFG